MLNRTRSFEEFFLLAGMSTGRGGEIDKGHERQNTSLSLALRASKIINFLGNVSEIYDVDISVREGQVGMPAPIIR